MEKKILVVPKGIRFLSEWKEFGLPNFPCIIDKKIPGCGFTEFCITSGENIVLCSPRKLLLENKERQHQSEVFYVKNEFDQDNEVDKDLEKQPRGGFAMIGNLYLSSPKEDDTQKKEASIAATKQQIKDYIYYCNGNGKPIKLLVTYDSFKYVREVLDEINFLEKFQIVIDEFQSIFVDSRFKASTELDFLNHIQGISRLSFVSATPMIDEYLEELDEFKDLPYFELDWASEDLGRVLKPDLKVKTCRSINEPAYEIIQKYLDGDFSGLSYRDSDGTIKTVYSKEAVFFVNSVTNILSIINKCGLKPEQCNVIIANTKENKKKLKRRLGKAWEIGTPPLQGEPHKMFTFCTRTVYLGADFYSTCARTFVLSDANVETLSVDISLDLPQILGRQRNLENPWKNRAEFYYKTTRVFLNEDEFKKFLQVKLDKTDALLRTFAGALDNDKYAVAEKYKKEISSGHYKTDYVAVNGEDNAILLPCLNKLVYLAERRAFDIQQIDYKDRFSVFNTLNEKNLISNSTEIHNFLEKFEEKTVFIDKMKFLCESDLGDCEISIILDQIPLIYKNYYQTLGPERCKAFGYEKNKLEKELELQKFDKGGIRGELDFVFKVGEIYSLSDIKDKLGTLYDTLGYKKTPKATDLKEYYEVKTCKKQENRVRVDCYKIIKKL